MNVIIFSNVKNLSNKRGEILLRMLFITEKVFQSSAFFFRPAAIQVY